MTEPTTIYRASRDRPETVPARALPVTDAAAHARAAAPPRRVQGVGPDVTAERNGRLPRGCPETDWIPSWSRALDTAATPTAVLANDARGYIAGRYNWQLFNPEDGAIVSGAQKGRGHPWLEPSDGLLVQPDPEGRLNGLAQEDGGERLWISLFMAGEFTRPYVARVGDALIVHGIERDQQHGSPVVPTLSSIEAWPLGEPRDIGPTLQLRPGGVEPVVFTNRDVLCAAWRGGVVTADPGRVLWFSHALQATQLVVGSFRPVALSLDESGWVHLLVDEGETPANDDDNAEPVPGQRALWVMNPSGQRILRWSLPDPLHRADTPPLVGHGHRVSVIGGGMLLTVEPTGGIAWCRPVAEGARATVCADDQVLVSEGKQITVFDTTGQRRVLCTVEEPLVTRPILTANGRLLAASNETLYCFVPVVGPS